MAKVEGVTGTSFTLVAKSGYISIADGGSIYNWAMRCRPVAARSSSTRGRR